MATPVELEQEIENINMRSLTRHQERLDAAAVSFEAPAPDRVKVLRDALEAYEKHMGEMQAAATRHLSIGHRQDEFVNAMLYLLDGPEQRAVQALTRAALKCEPVHE
jgi:hypothetical protein